MPDLKAAAEATAEICAEYNRTIGFNKWPKFRERVGGETVALQSLSKLESAITSKHSVLAVVVGPMLKSHFARLAYVPPEQTPKKRKIKKAS